MKKTEKFSSSKKRMNRREALSTIGKISVSVAVTGIAAGLIGYYAGSTTTPTKTVTLPPSTVTKTKTVTEHVTSPSVATTSVVTTPATTTTTVVSVTTPTMVRIVTYHGHAWGVYGTDEQRFDFNKMLHEDVSPMLSADILHFDVSVFTSTLNSMFAAGNPPDIFMMWGGKKIQAYVANDQCADMTPLYEEFGWFDLIPEFMIDEYRDLAGKTGIWGLCEVFRWEHETYNAEIFEKYDIKPPTTYSEWVDMCETLVANGVYPYVGFGNAYGCERLFSRAFEKVCQGKGDTYGWEKLTATRGYEREMQWTDDKVIEAFYMLKEWWDKKYIHPGFFGFGWDEEQAALAKGEAAVIIEGIWEPGFLDLNFPNLKYGTFFFPTNDDPSKVRWETYAEGYSIAKTTDKYKEAGIVLNYWLSDRVQETYAKKSHACFLPNPRANSTEWIPKPVWDMWLQLQKGQPTRQVCHTAFTEDFVVILRSYIRDVMQGAISPEKAAAKLEDQASKLEKEGKY